MKRIFKAIESGKCLAFLGAGASMGYRKNGTDVPGLPSGGALAKMLATRCEYRNGTTFDLDKVAEQFIFHENGDREELEALLRQEIAKVGEPRPIHTALAQLNDIKVVLTSNYDQLLETAFMDYGRTQTRHVYNPNNPRNAHFQGSIFLKDNDVILHKMHGSIDEPGSLVITQSDYIRYLATLHDLDKGMPEYFHKVMIPQCTLLFLGYGLQDWNFRVIWEGVLANYKSTGVQRDSFALVKDSTEFQRDSWLKRNIKIIDKDLTDFARELAGHFNLEIPQLGVKRKNKGEKGKS